MTEKIDQSVGKRWGTGSAPNLDADQQTIMRLLDQIPEDLGGTKGRTWSWGTTRPYRIDRLYDTILFFQSSHGGLIKDGVVDPNGRTLAKMNEIVSRQVRPEPKPGGGKAGPVLPPIATIPDWRIVSELKYLPVPGLPETDVKIGGKAIGFKIEGMKIGVRENLKEGFELHYAGGGFGWSMDVKMLLKELGVSNKTMRDWCGDSMKLINTLLGGQKFQFLDQIVPKFELGHQLSIDDLKSGMTTVVYADSSLFPIPGAPAGKIAIYFFGGNPWAALGAGILLPWMSLVGPAAAAMTTSKAIGISAKAISTSLLPGASVTALMGKVWRAEPVGELIK